MIVEGGQTYRVSHRCALVASQEANARLFELRNGSSSVRMIVHEVTIAWLQTANQTAAIEDSLDLYKVTGFTVIDANNTVTPVASEMKTATNASVAVLRGVTVAGAAAGMTGGTLTKDGTPMCSASLWLLAAIPTGGPVPSARVVYAPLQADGEGPLTLTANEGIIVENRALLGAASGASAYVTVTWSEMQG